MPFESGGRSGHQVEGTVRHHEPDLNNRLSRTLTALCSLVIGSVVLSALYAQVYSLPFQMPDIRIGAATLARTYAAFIPMLGVLAVLVVGLGHAPTIASAAGVWFRLTKSPKRARVGGMVAAGVGAVVFAWVRIVWNEQAEGWTLAELTAGEGQTPFQYRALVPWIARGLAALGVFDPASASQLHLVYGAFEAIAAFAAVVAFAALLRALSVSRDSSFVLAPVLFYPLFFSIAAGYQHANLYFSWDTPSIAFFTAGIVAVLRRRWRAYYLVFFVATFNRETTCFLTMIYILLEWEHSSWRTLAQHVVTQFVIWITVKAALVWVYVDNLIFSSGHGVFWLMIDSNLRVLSTVPGWFYLLQAMGGIWVVTFLLAPWIREPRLIRALWVAVPFVLGMLVVGIVSEVRIFNELIPLVLAALVLICRNVMRDALARENAPNAVGCAQFC